MSEFAIGQLHLLPDALLAWYDINKRDLPWRRDISAYRTWVSEIMLQQTRVSAVIPYFERFMETFPTVESLAVADQEQLLKLWEGLGYYSRARNLQKAAQQIVNEYNGLLPVSYSQLITLPGIGDYTAGAISSIAYGQKVPAVDGNVLRVVARITGCDANILDDKVKKTFREAMESIIPDSRCGEFNQALMDLGAMICTPGKQTMCPQCPACSFCQAFQQGKQEDLPVRIKKTKRKVENKTVFLMVNQQRIALCKRQEHGLLSSLWEYPNIDGIADEQAAASFLSSQGISVHQWIKKLSAHHLFSHIRWDMTGYVLEVTGSGCDSWQWCTLDELSTKAVPSAFASFTKEIPHLLHEEVSHDL